MLFVLIQEADGPGGTPPSRDRYEEMVREAMLAEEVGGALAAVAHCAASTEAAEDAARDVADHFVGLVAEWYDRLSSSSDSYGEMAGLNEIVEQRHDLGALIARAPYLSIGTPEFFVERAVRLAALGYDEFILRIEGMRHEDHMEAIRPIGREVIPAVAGLAATPVPAVAADGGA